MRRADLAQFSGRIHDGDAIGNGQRDFLIVRDIQDRNAEFLLQRLNLETHFLAQVGVEVVQRFVEQQQAGLGDQRPRQRDTLLLAAGKL